LSAQALQSR